MVRGVSTGGNKKTLGKMKEAIDKVIEERRRSRSARRRQKKRLLPI